MIRISPNRSEKGGIPGCPDGSSSRLHWPRPISTKSVEYAGRALALTTPRSGALFVRAKPAGLKVADSCLGSRPSRWSEGLSAAGAGNGRCRILLVSKTDYPRLPLSDLTTPITRKRLHFLGATCE
jgi:hypothetical protein